MVRRLGHELARDLEALFRRKPVAELGELQRCLGTTSRASVYRALSKSGYLTSYSHAGRYYTLQSIPRFNANGVWFYDEARFSRHGTLRDTILVLIHGAASGYTHEELEAILGLRLHDTLRALVGAQLLARERVGASYVYLDGDSGQAAAQLGRRHDAASPEVITRNPPLDPARVVAVLVAVIHAPRDDVPTVASRLRARGIEVTDDQVEAVFACYDLEKKTARSRSRRSPR